MNRLNILNYLRIKFSPFFVLNKKQIYPTSDLFLWHKKLNTHYMLLNNNFIFKEKGEVSIRLFILDNKGKVRKINLIEKSLTVFTKINISEYLEDSYGEYGSFCIFQTVKGKDYSRSERGYVYYQNKLSKTISLVHGNFDAVFEKDLKINSCSSTTKIKRYFNVQNHTNLKEFTNYVFSNPTKKAQILKLYDSNMNKIDQFILDSLGITIVGPYNSQIIYVKSSIPLCRPIIINNIDGTNLDIYHA